MIQGIAVKLKKDVDLFREQYIFNLEVHLHHDDDVIMFTKLIKDGSPVNVFMGNIEPGRLTYLSDDELLRLEELVLNECTKRMLDE